MSHRPPTTFPTPARAPLALASAALLAAGALLTACGGSDSPANAAARERAQEQNDETKLADFAKCMREHGVNAETASGPDGGRALKVSPGSAGSGPAAMEAAQKACARYRPAEKRLNLSPQQKVELEERLQKFAKCMREHGIKVEVSTAGGGAQIAIHHSASGGPNPQSPAFQAAQSACQKLLPRPPGAGPGGPFGAKGGPSGSGAPAG
jgi:hypothetical protein